MKNILIIVVAITITIIGTSVYLGFFKKKEISNQPTIPLAEETLRNSQNYLQPDPNAKYITAVPVDLSQIQSFSKFRSCAGHDFSSFNFDGAKETDRSMKNYFFPIPEFQGTVDKVRVFAPFDGAVAKIILENEKIIYSPGLGHIIEFSNSIDPCSRFGFDHIFFSRDFKVGDKIKAGELIGYASLKDKGYDFDIVLSGSDQKYFDSMFDHMTESVLAEFSKYNITPENAKWEKEYRDSHPCNYEVDGGKTDNRLNDDWVKLRPSF